ncbi:MAG TPA: pyrroloquinoline quinone biosynthesis peptide chaperone PqqD [Terriglobales bacterium]
MAAPNDSDRPRLAAGCRWGGSAEARVLLVPEGAIRVQGPGEKILQLCDGSRTFAEVLAELEQAFSQGDPAKIRADAARFLEQLHDKRVVDY